MEIVYVAGGSYKSFYLNYFLKLKKCDLLLFNFGIFYHLNFFDKTSPVIDELKMLSNSLGCVVVAGVFCFEKNKIKKVFLICEKGEIRIKSILHNTTLSILDKNFVLTTSSLISKGKNKIVISDKRLYPNVGNCSKRKTYIFCDNRGVTLVKNKKLKRKFNKYSKFILK